MKCEVIRDLLPLYIDGLVSKESRQEIDRHLASCKECRTYYEEMTGDISNIASVSVEDLQDADLIKRIKKKNRRKMIGILIGTVLVVSIITILIFPQSLSQVKYKEVDFNYGINGDKAFFTIDSKPGYELRFSGSATGNDSALKIFAIRKIGSFQKDKMGWENEIGTKDDPCKWTIEFEDKTIVIVNGELVEETKNKSQ